LGYRGARSTERTAAKFKEDIGVAPSSLYELCINYKT